MSWKTVKQHFTPDEFDCHCKECRDKNTGKEKMDPGFIDKLYYGRINSNVSYDIRNGCGYRCKKHNKEIGGSRTSLHPEGKAADIPFKNKTLCYRILFGLFMAGFKRMQVYQRQKNVGKHKKGSGWIHVDIYKGKSKPGQWFSIKEV